MADVPLDRLQRWMQEVVVHLDGDVEAASATPCARDLVPAVGDVILPSARLTAAERVGIYQGMYLLRMEDALAADYPGLKHFLGDDRFRSLVREYVRAFPSRSYTLNRLGDALPRFLREPPSGTGTRARWPRPGFCADLAAVELATTEAFDAEETPALSAEAIAAVPEEAWASAVLQPVASLRLLALRYPVGAWLDSLRSEGHEHPAIRRRDTWVLVYRREYQVYRQELTRPAHDLLASLAAGRPLGHAVLDLLARRRGVDAGQLFRWFRQWVGAGLFTGVRVTPQ
jgi:hypothetical protein